MDKVFDARIVAPAGIIYAGCPFSGKTTHILKLLKNRERLFTKKFDYIYWFYGQYNDTIKMFEEYPQMNIIPVAGLPENIDDYIFSDRQGCHVYDDLMDEASSNKTLLDLASRKCHHNSVSWILVMQNLFHHYTRKKVNTRWIGGLCLNVGQVDIYLEVNFGSTRLITNSFLSKR